MKEVTVYSTRTCPYCRQAEQFLTSRGVAFKKIDVTDDEDLRARLVELSGGMRTVPQIFIGARSIGGYTDMMALHRKGALDALLAGENDEKPG